MLLAQVLEVAGTPETTALLLDAIERFENELHVRYLDSQMQQDEDRPATAWQPLRQRAIRLLLHKTPCVRVAACHLLRALPGQDAVERLLICLTSRDQAVRTAAVEAVATQGDPHAIPVLEALVGGADRYSARIAYAEWAIDALGHTPAQLSVDRLVALLQHPRLAPYVARVLLCNPHPTAWRAALPLAAAAPASWRGISDNFMYAAARRLGPTQAAERRRTVAALVAAATPQPVDPAAAASYLPGTWTDVGNETDRHIFTRDAQWYMYDGERELVIEGTWQANGDGTVSLWSGVSHPTLVRHDERVVITDPDERRPITLRKLADTVEVPAG